LINKTHLKNAKNVHNVKTVKME